MIVTIDGPDTFVVAGLRDLVLLKTTASLRVPPGKVVTLSRDAKGRLVARETMLILDATFEVVEDNPRNAPFGDAVQLFVDRAIEDAAFILERIDARRPMIVNSFSPKEP